MDEISNPYRPGAGILPPALVGRDALIDHFGMTVRRALHGRPGKSLMPIGLRGVGKTVLLNRFVQIADNEGFEADLIEASESGEFRRQLTISLRKKLFALRRSRVTKGVLAALSILKAFAIQLPDGSSFSIDVDAAVGQGDTGDLAEDLTELFVASGIAACEQKTGFLLAIDEVQYLSREELSALIRAIHRTSQLDLPVVLVGAGLPQLPGLAGEAKSYAERLFDFPEIGPLSRNDAADALRLPAEQAGAFFREGSLEIVLAESHGYPYFLQEWGYHVWNTAAEGEITVDDVRRAGERVTTQLDRNFFLVRFDRLTPKEKDYLRAMAELGPGPHRSGDIATMLGVKVESVAPRRSNLIKKGMIYSPAHGDTAFTVPLFDEYLKRTLPEWVS